MQTTFSFNTEHMASLEAFVLNLLFTNNTRGRTKTPSIGWAPTQSVGWVKISLQHTGTHPVGWARISRPTQIERLIHMPDMTLNPLVIYSLLAPDGT